MSHKELQQKEYAAFISYSHNDEAFAVHLQNYLETYIIPKSLRRICPDIPTKTRPIARDEDTLSNGELHQELAHIISRSKNMIVICSSSSAQPNQEGKRYVDWEIHHFMQRDEKQQHERIIPIVLRDPNTESLEDCIPPSVQECGSPVIDVAEMGEERAFNAVAARLHGVHPEALWGHHNQRKRVHRRIAALLLLFLCSICYCWYVSRIKTHEEYFSTISWQGGEGLSAFIPHGIEETRLSPFDRKKYFCYFRFTYQGDKLLSVAHIQNDECVDGELFHCCRLPAMMSFEYERGKNEVRKISFISFTGKEEFSVVACNQRNVIRLYRKNGDAQEQLLSPTLLGDRLLGLVESHAHADLNQTIPLCYAKIEWQPEQHSLYLHYLTANGMPFSPQQRGDVTGVRLRLNPETHMIEEGTWLGRPPCYRGVINLYSSKDKGCQLLERRLQLSEDVEPDYKDEHVSSIYYEWGTGGCCTRCEILDVKGNLYEDTIMGYHPSSRMVEREQRDNMGNSSGTEVFEQTHNGIMTFLRDDKGELIPYANGVMRIRKTFDKGKGIEIYHLESTDGSLTHPTGEQYNCIVMKYDSTQAPVERSYFHKSFSYSGFRNILTPVNSSQGYSKTKWFYNTSGQLLSEQHYDVDGNCVDIKPIFSSSVGTPCPDSNKIP